MTSRSASPGQSAAANFDAMVEARRRDPIGHVVHTALAAIYMFLLPLATAPKDVAFGILLGYAILRLPNTWRCYRLLTSSSTMLLVTAWAAWSAATMIWSPDRLQGLDELKAMRVLFTPLMLWPVLDQAPWLIGSMLAGVFAQNLVQLAQQLRWFGLEPSMNLRLVGLLHAIQTGAFCTAAIIWHLGLLLRVRLNERSGVVVAMASLVGLAAAGFGLVFSGSRGPWISALATIPLMLVVISIRRRGAWWRAGLLALVVVGAAAASWPWTGPFVVNRVNQALAGLDEAVRGQVGSEDQRAINWIYAWQIFERSPVTGAGAGSYKLAAPRTARYQALEADNAQTAAASVLPHPHSIYLYLLACTGLVGLGIFAALAAALAIRSWHDPPNHFYADGTLFVLISWLLGAAVECYNLNGHTFGLLGIVAAFTLRHRPAPDHLLRSSAGQREAARSTAR